MSLAGDRDIVGVAAAARQQHPILEPRDGLANTELHRLLPCSSTKARVPGRNPPAPIDNEPPPPGKKRKRGDGRGCKSRIMLLAAPRARGWALPRRKHRDGTSKARPIQIGPRPRQISV